MRHHCLRKLLEAIVEKNRDTDTRGNACFTLAVLRKDEAKYGKNKIHIQMSLSWVKPFGRFPTLKAFVFDILHSALRRRRHHLRWSFQLGEGALQLHIAGCPRDIMSDHAAKSLRLDGRQFAQSILDHRSAQRDKSISIVKAKWRKLVTLPANIQGVSKRHSNLARILPEFPCWLVSFGSGLVKGAFLLAKGQIDRRDRLPRPILKPPLIHAPCGRLFYAN